MSEIPTLYADYKKALDQRFAIADWVAVDIIFAVAVAHYMVPGESLWIRLIGTTRSGRTELLRPLTAHPDIREIEVLTPSAIRGGLRNGAKVLERVRNHLVVTKDFAALLTARRDTRNEVFGLLRGLKDGKLTSDFGSDEGHLVQEGSFDWILAVTGIIEQQRLLEGLLGTRFIDLRWYPGDCEKMAITATKNNPGLKAIRKELGKQMRKLLDSALQQRRRQPPTVDIEWIAKVANQATLWRSAVQRDSHHQLLAMPNPEPGTDLGQGFARIAQGLVILGIEDYKAHIWRLFQDAIPDIRRHILRELHADIKEGKQTSTTDLANRTGLSQPTVSYHLEDIRLLKIDINRVLQLNKEGGL